MGGACCVQFTREQYEDIRDQCAELSHELLDGIVIGQIMAHIANGTIVGLRNRHTPSARKRAHMIFYHHRVRICKETFLHLHGIGTITFSYSLVVYHNMFRKRSISGTESTLPG